LGLGNCKGNRYGRQWGVGEGGGSGKGTRTTLHLVHGGGAVQRDSKDRGGRLNLRGGMVSLQALIMTSSPVGQDSFCEVGDRWLLKFGCEQMQR